MAEDAIISQAALLQQTGGQRVLHDQLAHLARTIEERPEVVQVRVIPFTATDGAPVKTALKNLHTTLYRGPRPGLRDFLTV